MGQKKPSQRKVKKTGTKKSVVSKGKVKKNTDKSVFFRRKKELLIVSKKRKQGSESPLFLRRKEDLEELKKLTDSELIDVVQNQNKEAYTELFQRYQRKIFIYIFHLLRNKEETEDIIQNVFTKTYKNMEHFDKNRKFSSWIYRIAHNEAINFLKRKNKKYFISWEDISTTKDKIDMRSMEMSAEEKWMHAEITKEIDDAIAKLPKKYREILKLRYFSEYSYDEIGEILNKPINTVGTIIGRAKKKLFEIVKNDQIK